jgi:hypothetical protein
MEGCAEGRHCGALPPAAIRVPRAWTELTPRHGRTGPAQGAPLAADSLSGLIFVVMPPSSGRSPPGRPDCSAPRIPCGC